MNDFFFSELGNNGWLLANGLLQTILVSIGATIGGTMVGLPLGVGLYRSGPITGFLLSVLIDVVRGTPVLVLVLASYYVLPVLGLNVSAFWAGVIAFGLFCGAQTAEIVRGALQALDRGQTDAALSIGLTRWQLLLDILLPQAMRIGWPAWFNTVIEVVKGSPLLLIIGVSELMLTTQQIMSRTQMSVQFLTLAGGLYFVLNYSLERLASHIEHRLQFEKIHVR